MTGKKVNEFLEREEWDDPTFELGEGLYQVCDPAAEPSRYGLHVVDGRACRVDAKHLYRVFEDISGLSASCLFRRTTATGRTAVFSTVARQYRFEVFDTPEPCTYCGGLETLLYLPGLSCGLCAKGGEDDLD